MRGPEFLTEPEPPRGVAFAVAPGLRRLVAANPGPMTYHGTNTYLADSQGGVTVVDPGPDDPAHVAAILEQAGGPVVRIFITHRHPDHVGALAGLVAALQARGDTPPVHAFAGADLPNLAPLEDNARVGLWTALHTPGHAADHLCFAREDGTVLTGDHVMSFSTSVVIPPDGDMAGYMASLRRMLARDDAVFLPGHGPPIQDPRPFTEALLAHRLHREAEVLRAIGESVCAASEIVTALYPALDTKLLRFAEASVTAHLIKLEREGRAARDGARWRGTSPSLRGA